MSRKETADSTETTFGVWGAVGPSNHVLDGSPHLPMVRGNFGDFLPIKNHWHCVLPSVHRAEQKDAEAIRLVASDLRSRGRGFDSQSGRRCATIMGKLTFLATMRPFIELLRSLVQT